MFETVNMQQWVLATAFMVILMAGFALLLKRFLPHHSGLKRLTEKRSKIVENTYLSPKHQLCIVKIDAAEHAVILHPTGATHLGPLLPPLEQEE